jgi:hypothetical protein
LDALLATSSDVIKRIFERKISISQYATEGGLARGEVQETLIFVVGEKESGPRTTYLPYSKGSQITWKEPHTAPEGSERGVLCESLAKILLEPPVADNEELTKTAEKFGIQYDRDRKIFHTSKVALKILSLQGFKTEDYFSSKHPEWIDGK